MLSWSQESINAYKYIIVPKKFDSFKEVNQFKTSTMLKFLFVQKGFNTVYDDQLPTDLNSNHCLGLTANLIDDSNMFTTKTTIVLKDCNGAEIFRTEEGISKEKEYKAAFNEAIKEAMNSFSTGTYAYKSKLDYKEPITVSFKNDVKRLEEHKEDVADKNISKEVHEVDIAVVPTVKGNAVTQIATDTVQSFKDVSPVASDYKKVEKALKEQVVLEQPNMEDVMYAQVVPNGYQLVDSTPKIRMKLLKSSIENVFMAETNEKSGMVYIKDGSWIFEYYSGEQLIQEPLNIKF